MTTKSEISMWFDHGVLEGAAYMLVVCDTYDHEDYPVYAADDATCMREFANCTEANMQRVMEVYDLRLDKAEQMSARRVFNLPKAK